MAFGLTFLGFRLWQGLHVHLLVYVEGDGLYLHGDGRDHIRGLFIGYKGVKLLNVNFFIAYYVCRQEFSAAGAGLVKSLDGNVPDAREFPYHGLHFLQFNAEAADLHLAVTASKVFYLSIGPLADYVSGAVDAGKFRLFLKGVGDEYLGGLIRPVEVSKAHLPAGNPQFSAFSLGDLPAVLIYNIGMYALKGKADRDVVLLHFHFLVHHVTHAFRRTVAVEKPVMRKRET